MQLVLALIKNCCQGEIGRKSNNVNLLEPSHFSKPQTCGMIPMLFRSVFRGTVAVSTSSMMMWPCEKQNGYGILSIDTLTFEGTVRRKSARSRDDLPAPVLPTIPI